MAKPRKYAVFSIGDLEKMIAFAKGKRKGGKERTVLAQFEMSGRKWPGQLWFRGLK